MRLSFIISILLLCNSVFSQSQNLFKHNIKFKNYTTKEGLSQTSVISILQDNKGFMWFGTRYGLNKFDGYTFKNYNFNSDDSTSISNNRISKVFKDLKGDIWIGTNNGLSKYNPEEDNFKRINYSKNKFYENSIVDITQKSPTEIIISSSKGLDFYDIEKERFVTSDETKFISQHLSSKEVKTIFISKKGIIFIATKSKVDVYDPNLKTYNYVNYPNNETLTNSGVVTFFENDDAKILMGYIKGLVCFNAKEQRFIPHQLASNKEINDPVRAIKKDQYKNLWVGTYKGLIKIDKNGQSTKYTHSFKDDTSLIQNSIYDLYFDTSHGLWIGTWGGGLSYYNERLNNYLTYKEGSSKNNLNSKVVSSFIEIDSETLWIGTETGGINILDTKSNSFSFIENNPTNKNSISSNNVKRLLKDYKNDVWVGTHGEGLNKIENIGKNQKVIRYNNLSDKNVTALFEDNKKNIWIGTNEGGVNHLNTITNKITVIDSADKMGYSVYDIIQFDEDHLYVATNFGLSSINIHTKEIEVINFREGKIKPFQIKTVTTVYKEYANSLWIGTEGDGLYHYNLQTKTSTRYALSNGLLDEFIHSIEKDDFGNIWVSTYKGLSMINLDTKKVNNYKQDDGLQSNEFNFNASLKRKNNDLVFGGVGGFTYFKPSNIKQDSFIPPISINSFQLRNETEKVFLKSTENLILEHHENDFSINFIALEYTKPNKINYAYILEGSDQDWNFVGNIKSANYTNISPGNYTFKVKASNTEGDWVANNTASFKFTIKKPLWKTYWAYSFYLILALLVFWLIRRYELLRIKNKNELKQERLDKNELKEINKLKLQLFTNISHDFRTPLTLIIGPLKKLISEKNVSNDVQGKLELMYRNAQTLLQLINQLLDFRKSEAGKLNINATKNNIVTFVEDCKLSFEELAISKNIKYTLFVAEEIENLWFDKIEMKKVIMNILSNAFKFTPNNGSISIQISYNLKDKSKVKIKITDTGKGIPAVDLENVFDRYFQLGQKNEQRSGTGVGLALAKDIVELHKGIINVKSEVDKGTEFTVQLQKGNSHFKKSEILEMDNLEENLENYDSTANVKSGWVRKDEHIEVIDINPELQTVLIVEDNNDVRSFIHDIFKNIFNTVLVTNGHEGIKAAKEYDVDVIISDLMMPKMDGLEMAKILKSDIQTSHIPIIMLTARTSSKVQKEGYETGADAYITKPFDAENLKLQVYNILKSRKYLIQKFKKDILIAPKEITVVSADEKFLNNAMAIIEENFSNPDFNVNSFREKMFMSQSLLYKKLKVLTGQSITEFIRTVRLKKASQLLLKTDTSIKNIVYDIGFNDIKYFRKCFKNSFQMTPTQYREQNQIK